MQASRPTLSNPLVTLDTLCAAISHERLGAYSLRHDRDSTDAVARYLWNGALCVAFHPSLHALEVALRNNIFRESQATVDTNGRQLGTFGCWLDATPPLLLDRERKQIDEARRRLGPPRFHTHGRLIAKLGFGFWTSLCGGQYAHGAAAGPRLWPRLLEPVFPALDKRLRTREHVADRLNNIRTFRNRIAHHEPIWDHKLLEHYDEILGVLGWMYPDMALAVRACGNLEYAFHTGPDSFRPLASRLLGCG